MKIYTKTGDHGKTSLFGGKRVEKSNIRIEAYGTIDELNSILGLALSESLNKKTLEISKRIQNTLFAVGADLATPEDTVKKTKSNLNDEEIKFLEESIDELEGSLEPLTNFILPGGSKTASLFHFARTVCRRAERRIVEVSHKEKIDENIIIYVNRLSDLLFVIARFENHVSSTPEIVWNTRG